MIRRPNSGNVGVEMEIDRSINENDVNRKELSDEYGRQSSNVYIERATFKERVLNFLKYYGVYILIVFAVSLLVMFAE